MSTQKQLDKAIAEHDEAIIQAGIESRARAEKIEQLRGALEPEGEAEPEAKPTVKAQSDSSKEV